MDSNYGKTIAKIRVEKNIPVQELLTGICGRTAYSNFVKGKNSTSIDTFMKLLDKLHVSFTEFQYISNDFEINEEQKFINDLQNCISVGDIEGLSELLKRVINNCYIYEDNDKYIHLACITKLTINKLKNESLNQEAKKIIMKYLIECETWTHYEIMIFNNAMFIFSADQIRAFQTKVVHNIERYQSLRVYGNESFRVLLNILMIFIDNKAYKDIRITGGLIDNYQLKEDMLFEKNLKLYFSGVINLIEGRDVRGLEEIQKALNIFKMLNAKNYEKNLKKYIEYIIKKYDLEIKL
nr:hypothetical protein [uncultured Ligilactobacillus sp.]